MKNFKRRKLQIKAFHIDEVIFSKETSISNNSLSLGQEFKSLKEVDQFNYIKELKIEIIKIQDRNRFVNSIMDFIPISTKVLGDIGEGITHTLTGVNAMITGVDEDGTQVAEFGSSEGILSEQVVFGRAGTPGDQDIIIHFDLILRSKGGQTREGIDQVHQLCDLLIQEIRKKLKLLKGRDSTEVHEFYDKINPEGKKVVILKQVAGQGAMYDTRIFSKEPSGYQGGRSIIDLYNMPILLTPNEYRDGAIKAMH